MLSEFLDILFQSKVNWDGSFEHAELLVPCTSQIFTDLHVVRSCYILLCWWDFRTLQKKLDARPIIYQAPTGVILYVLGFGRIRDVVWNLKKWNSVGVTKSNFVRLLSKGFASIRPIVTAAWDFWRAWTSFCCSSWSKSLSRIDTGNLEAQNIEKTQGITTHHNMPPHCMNKSLKKKKTMNIAHSTLAAGD